MNRYDFLDNQFGKRADKLIQARVAVIREWKKYNDNAVFPLDMDLDELVPDTEGVMTGMPSDKYLAKKNMDWHHESRESAKRNQRRR